MRKYGISSPVVGDKNYCKLRRHTDCIKQDLQVITLSRSTVGLWISGINQDYTDFQSPPPFLLI